VTSLKPLTPGYSYGRWSDGRISFDGYMNLGLIHYSVTVPDRVAEGDKIRNVTTTRTRDELVILSQHGVLACYAHH
jgi:hypothetical protein